MRHLITLFCLLVSLCMYAVSSGTCGENVKWSFNSATGELNITGKGAMFDLNNHEEQPWYEFAQDIKTLRIGEGVTRIGNKAFRCLIYLDNVELSNTVESIGEYVFDNCVRLKRINIPGSVKRMEYEAFSVGYGTMEEVLIDDLSAWLKIDFINNGANPAHWSESFKLNGIELTEVIIPEDISEIKDFAFNKCANIEKITILGEISKVGAYALHETAWYNNQADGEIYLDKVLYEYKGTMPEGTNVIVKEGTKIISWNAFSRCTGMTSISFPNSLVLIEDDAFTGCSGLTNITFPESLVAIGEFAFSRCSGLEELIIPQNLNNIGYCAFKGCSELKRISVDENNLNYDSRNNCNALIETSTNTLLQGCNNTIIPQGISVIGHGAFSHCLELKKIEIPNTITAIKQSAFDGCKNLEELLLPNSVTELGGAAFAHCASLTEFVIPNSVTEIDGSLFNYCSSLKKVSIPSSITKISNWMFCNCSNLTTVELHNSIDSIGAYAFSSCTALTDFVIPNSVKVIEEYAFNWCKGLKEIVIGKGVEEIGQSVFRECPNLEVVNSYIENPMPILENTFTNYNATLYIPKGTEQEYKNTSYWSLFSNVIEKFDLSGINTPNVDNMPVEYYDLSGQRVYNPELGIFIKKQGSKTSKVILK